MGGEMPSCPLWQVGNPRICDGQRVSKTQAQARAEDVARAAYGKLIAMLASKTGDIIAAEDALADAFVASLKTGQDVASPTNPRPGF